MKKISLSTDEETIKAGRELAKRHNISLNAFIRRLFKKPVEKTTEQWIEDSFQLVKEAQANSRGKIWKRLNLYRL